MLHVDIPTLSELAALRAARGTAHVSIYVPTTPQTQDIGAAQTTLNNLLKEAEAQLAAADTAKRTIWPLAEQIADLQDDEEFWRFQAHSLAIFLTPDSIRTFRLPNRLTAMVEVSDRFHLKPLIRAVTVPQHAFVLALMENEVRVIEVTGDLPASEIKVQGMPADAHSAVGVSNVNSRSHGGRLQGDEGQKVLLKQYCRKVDAALRPLLAGRTEPLVLAATEPLLSLYRGMNTYAGLAVETIRISPVRASAAELAAATRPILDALHTEALAAFHATYAARANEGRATTDIANAARAATFGAVDTLLVDIDEVVIGTVDDATGAVTFADAPGAASYGVVDEIAGRVMAAGGRVLGVRKDDIPGGASLAAVLRYAI